nr:hypothetical protein [uncultured Actinotalea sp.]
MTEQTPRPVGWHADVEADRYRFWDGESWAFAASRRDLPAYRDAGQRVAGVDFDAPVHSELPPEQKERRSISPVAAGAGVLALVALVVILLVAVL